MKKLIVILIFCIFTGMLIFAQTAETSVNTETEQNTSNDSIITTSNFFLKSGLVFIANTNQNSAPSPILFTVGGGYEIPISSWFSFTPQGQLYVSTYLWDSDTQMAVPAEIENRTASVFSSIIDLPADLNFSIKGFRFGIQVGAAFILRYGVQSLGVSEDVDNDVSNSNSWFYSNGRFFYPSFGLSLDKTLESGIRIGSAVAAYYPFPSFTDNTFPQDFHATVSFRLFIPTVN